MHPSLLSLFKYCFSFKENLFKYSSLTMIDPMLGKIDVESVEGMEAHAMPLKGSSMIRCPEEVSV